MPYTESQLRTIATEHDRYITRITPIIRARLAGRGKSEAEIADFMATLPGEHFAIRIRRALKSATIT